jgi:hypothetical protein
MATGSPVWLVIIASASTGALITASVNVYVKRREFEREDDRRLLNDRRKACADFLVAVLEFWRAYRDTLDTNATLATAIREGRTREPGQDELRDALTRQLTLVFSRNDAVIRREALLSILVGQNAQESASQLATACAKAARTANKVWGVRDDAFPLVEDFPEAAHAAYVRAVRVELGVESQIVVDL